MSSRSLLDHFVPHILDKLTNRAYDLTNWPTCHLGNEGHRWPRRKNAPSPRSRGAPTLSRRRSRRSPKSAMHRRRWRRSRNAPRISKGLISYHFAGKDELLEQIVEHVYTAGDQLHDPADAGGGERAGNSCGPTSRPTWRSSGRTARRCRRWSRSSRTSAPPRASPARSGRRGAADRRHRGDLHARPGGGSLPPFSAR